MLFNDLFIDVLKLGHYAINIYRVYTEVEELLPPCFLLNFDQHLAEKLIFLTIQ